MYQKYYHGPSLANLRSLKNPPPNDERKPQTFGPLPVIFVRVWRVLPSWRVRHILLVFWEASHAEAFPMEPHQPNLRVSTRSVVPGGQTLAQKSDHAFCLQGRASLRKFAAELLGSGFIHFWLMYANGGDRC